MAHTQRSSFKLRRLQSRLPQRGNGLDRPGRRGVRRRVALWALYKMPRQLRTVVWLLVASLVCGTAPAASTGRVLPPTVTQALDAVLECERPAGGWMYACNRNIRVAGFTSIMRRAERFAGAIGLAQWDLVVLRSPGTPAAGLLLIRAYQKTGNEKYLAAARRAGDLLVQCQLPSGGWFSEMPVYGNQLAGWFHSLLPWTSFGTTLDDDVTSGAVRFLLALWEVTRDSRYRVAAERGLMLLLKAQLPSGAWPLTWRPAWLRWLSPSFEDWPSINDAATTGVILTLIDSARILERRELLEAAQRGGRWLLNIRNPAPYAGWAQQYDQAGQPAPGRRFEPIALATWESRHALEVLQVLAETTGDIRFCRAFPETIDWLVQSTLAPGCWARFYDRQTNTPVYLGDHGQRVLSYKQARRPYRWTGDYGIPALFASLGLNAAGQPRGENSRTAVWRLPGDAGWCPDQQSQDSEQKQALGPRARILRAGSLLTEMTPLQRGACASLLSH